MSEVVGENGRAGNGDSGAARPRPASKGRTTSPSTGSPASAADAPAEPDAPAGPDAAGVPPTARRRVGRPARLDRDMIAHAAAEVGLGQVTMRSVADLLGVSVASLYHYVAGRDDLVRLAAERYAAAVVAPVDSGQHWARWLFEWADHARRSFVAEPALIEQFMNGVITTERAVDNLETVVEVLVRQGFTAEAAYDAYAVISNCALGAAVAEIRERRTLDAWPLDSGYHQIVARRPAGELRHVRALLAAGPPLRTPFIEHARTVLAGIAVRRGERWEDVVARADLETLTDAGTAATG